MTFPVYLIFIIMYYAVIFVLNYVLLSYLLSVIQHNYKTIEIKLRNEIYSLKEIFMLEKFLHLSSNVFLCIERSSLKFRVFLSVVLFSLSVTKIGFFILYFFIDIFAHFDFIIVSRRFIFLLFCIWYKQLFSFVQIFIW